MTCDQMSTDREPKELEESDEQWLLEKSEYNVEIDMQIDAKLGQFARLRTRLEYLILQQTIALQQAQAQRPGVIRLPGAMARWQKGVERVQVLMLRHRKRLDHAREIRFGLDIHEGGQIYKLASAKLRRRRPELAARFEPLLM